MNYEYRKGHIYSVPADVIGPELERIWSEHDEQLHASDVVEAARDENAPLHPVFEWDDTAAAEKYRLQQARNLIRAVRVNRPEGQKQLFVHVTMRTPEKTARHYQNIKVILNKPGEYLAGLEELKQKLESVQQAFSELERHAREMNGSLDDINKLAAILSALATARSVADRLQ